MIAIGHGHDAHRLAAGAKLVLGGVAGRHGFGRLAAAWWVS